ncbi:sesB-related regulatory [Fusarium mexicanum]|uniref:SesB-related regulatory n=1 Tax=Fusarium mexicanum TaxID=751941 RepID=A0A8H5ML87_9HYPO|nr:sesB-related regulatory [Fusarium mexicanum]
MRRWLSRWRDYTPLDVPPSDRHFPLGLEVVHSPPDAVVDIVCINEITETRDDAWKSACSLLTKEVPFVRITVFGYDGEKVHSLGELLDVERLKNSAEKLLDHYPLHLKLTADTVSSQKQHEHQSTASHHAVERDFTRDINRPVIFIAHGFGGLIYEQALALSFVKGHPKGQIRKHAAILFDTPHHGAGLAEWAIICAKRLRIRCAATPQKQQWSIFNDSFDNIKKMQTRFREIIREEVKVKILACYAVKPSSGCKVRLAPEWAVLPEFRPIAIENDHFGMTTLQNDHPESRDIAAILFKQIKALTEGMVQLAGGPSIISEENLPSKTDFSYTAPEYVATNSEGSTSSKAISARDVAQVPSVSSSTKAISAMSTKSTPASPDRSRWAVIVGVDHYGDGQDLGGCANDATLVYEYVTNMLHTPKDQTFMHISKKGNEKPVEGSLEASPKKVQESLEKVLAEAKNNNETFLHFHFSGHGAIQKTIFRDNAYVGKENGLHWFERLYPKLERSMEGEASRTEVPAKPEGAVDDVLCFPNNEDVTDVEFGMMMLRLAAAGIILSVTIDCCFAGGTLREGQDFAVRSKSRDPVNSARGYLSEGDANTKWGFREYIRHDSYFHGAQQEYNVMMACQAGQCAAEGLVHSGSQNRYGLFTHALITRLKEIESYRTQLTYDQFHGILGAVLHDKLRERQVPAISGPINRILFDKDDGVDSDDLAYIRVTQDPPEVAIVKGRTTGALIGDTYRPIDENSSNGNELLVEIDQVRDFDSTLKFKSDNQTQVSLFDYVSNRRIARLVGRKSIPILLGSDREEMIALILGAASPRLLKSIPSFHLISYTEDIAPLCKAPLRVQIRGALEDGKPWLELQNDNGVPFERLPKIYIDNSGNDPDAPKWIGKLLVGLEGMHNFQEFSRMKTPGSFTKDGNPFEFKILRATLPLQGQTTAQDSERPNDTLVASHTVHFVNTSSIPLYVTIFCLSSTYGIEIVNKEVRVNEGEEMTDSGGVYDTYIPHGTEIKYHNGKIIIHDTVRVIVSTRSVDLKCFEQNDVLGSNATESTSRYSKPRKVDWPTSGWWVEDRPIQAPDNEDDQRTKIVMAKVSAQIVLLRGTLITQVSSLETIQGRGPSLA